MTGLLIAQATMLVAQTALLIYGRVYLAVVAGLCGTGLGLTYGIIHHSSLEVALAIFGVVLWVLTFWFRGRRGPKRGRRKALGDESRQIRDGLVRRMREHHRERRDLQPSPSRS